MVGRITTGRPRPAVLAAAFALIAGTASMPHARADDWIMHQSAQSVGETVARLEAAITRSGSKVLAIFDHAQDARSVGLELHESTVILFAKPKSATAMIAGHPRAAIDMPQKILVWEEQGRTYAGYVSPVALVARHGVDPGHPELARLREGLDALIEAAIHRRDTRADEQH